MNWFITIFLYNSILWLIISCFFSCNEPSEETHTQQPIEEMLMHPLCGSDFCSSNGSHELINLLEDSNALTPIKLSVQLINATSSENSSLNPKDIESELNYIFRDAMIEFNVHSKIFFLETNHTIDTIFSDKNIKDDIIDRFNTKNHINIYIVAKGTFLNGYTNVLTENFALYKNTSLNYIFINEKALYNGNTIQHELGHFFGLQHTFGKSPMELSTDETPNGSNCASAGDYICDTPADPNGKIGKNCEFLGLNDGSKYPVTPDIHNFMSYYPSGCKMRFSPMQCKLMHNFAKKYRNYLSTL